VDALAVVAVVAVVAASTMTMVQVVLDCAELV